MLTSASLWACSEALRQIVDALTSNWDHPSRSSRIPAALKNPVPSKSGVTIAQSKKSRWRSFSWPLSAKQVAKLERPLLFCAPIFCRPSNKSISLATVTTSCLHRVQSRRDAVS